MQRAAAAAAAAAVAVASESSITSGQFIIQEERRFLIEHLRDRRIQRR